MTPDELKHALAVAKPFIEACRLKWAALMVTTKPDEQAVRESYYAMICGLNAIEREWLSASQPTPETTPSEPVATGWNGLPIEE